MAAADSGGDGDGFTTAASATAVTGLLPPHGRRAEAFVIDVSVVAVVFGLAVALDKVTDLPAIGLAIAAVVVWVYYVGATAWLMEGQSAGKAICELRVRPVTADRVPHSLRGLIWSVGRHTIGYIAVDVFLLGAVFAMVNLRRRCLHDYAFASEVTGLAGKEERPASFGQRYRSYWEKFADRYDELTKRNRWFFFPWKWLSKALVIVALLLDKALPAKGTSSTGGVPAPVGPAYVLSGKATAGLWAATATLSGLIAAATTWSPPQPSAEFVGTWTSVDSDGSNQQMEITQSDANESAYRVHVEDDWLTVCDGQPGSWTGDGTSSPGTNLLTVEVVVTCADGAERGPFTISFNYNPDQDTLNDNPDQDTWPLNDLPQVIWSRP